MKKRTIGLIIIILILMGFIYYISIEKSDKIVNSNKEIKKENSFNEENIREITNKSEEQIQQNESYAEESPTNLDLPYKISDLDLDYGSSHPLGIYRFSMDRQPHPGIDLQPKKGAEIFAMADGKVVYVKDDVRFQNYKIIRIQVKETNWAIEYESIIPESFIILGQAITKGQKIGTFDGGYALNPALLHIDLRYYYQGDFTMPTDFVCWLENLESAKKQQLQDAWDKAKVNEKFVASWKTMQMDGKYFLRGLLDKTKYPDGPRMCYPIGTDVRE